MTKQAKPRPKLEDIKGAVATVFNVEASDIDVKDRSHKYGRARGAVVLVARDIGMTNQQIAEGLAYKRASEGAGTVSQLNSKALSWQISNDKGFATQISKVRGWLQRNGFNVRPQTNPEFRNS